MSAARPRATPRPILPPVERPEDGVEVVVGSAEVVDDDVDDVEDETPELVGVARGLAPGLVTVTCRSYVLSVLLLLPPMLLLRTATLEYALSSIFAMLPKLHRCPFCGAEMLLLIVNSPFCFRFKCHSDPFRAFVSHHVSSPQALNCQNTLSSAISPRTMRGLVRPSDSSAGT